MVPRRAESWLPHMLQDPDVLHLDPLGGFVRCRVCKEHRAIHGGRPPRPVRMTVIFRTCAWELHKQRSPGHPFHRSWIPGRGGDESEQGEDEYSMQGMIGARRC